MSFSSQSNFIKQQDSQKAQELYSNKSLSVNSHKKKNENENPYVKETVKFRIFDIEKQIFEVADEMNKHKYVMGTFKDDKETTEETVKKNTKLVTDFLTEELIKVENEMKKHFDKQKQENDDLQNEILALKTEKTKLASEIIQSQRRITELEMLIGIDIRDEGEKALK